MTTHPAVIQIGFIHKADSHTPILMQRVIDCREEGNPDVRLAMLDIEHNFTPSTVIRFYDPEGRFSKYIEETSKVGIDYRKLREMYRETSRPKQLILECRVAWLARKKAKLEAEAKTFAYTSLLLAVNKIRNIAVRRNDGAFQLVDRAETAKLLQTALESTWVWAELFLHTDPLTSKKLRTNS